MSAIFWIGFLLGGIAGLGIGSMAHDMRYPTLYLLGCTIANALLIGTLSQLIYTRVTGL